MSKSGKTIAMVILGAIGILAMGIGTQASTTATTLQITSDNLDILMSYPENAYSGGNLLWSYGQSLDAKHKQPYQGHTQLDDTFGTSAL